MTSAKITPMIQQYLSAKEKYEDALLFFRMGDFYEMFFEDAEIASKVLEITLTSRNKKDKKPIPMCGVPVKAVRSYLSRLIEKGYKVAICDQVEDPSQAKGLVKRDVVRVVTPGMIVENELLDEKTNNYLLALAQTDKVFGLASLDISTGAFRVAETSDIHAAIAAQRSLLYRCGGHPMAAGLTIDPDRIPQFREALSQTVRDLGIDLSQEISLQIEAYIPLDELTLETVSDLERLAPFGPGNPPLILASRDIEIASHRTVGRGAEHRLVTVADRSGHTQQVIWWGASDLDLPVGSFDLAYTARSSTFRGKHDIQVEWIDARPAAGQQIELVSQPALLQVIDYRGIDQPERILKQLRMETGYQFWAEGQASQVIPGVNRYDLIPSPSLVICTSSPKAVITPRGRTPTKEYRATCSPPETDSSKKQGPSS